MIFGLILLLSWIGPGREGQGSLHAGTALAQAEDSGQETQTSTTEAAQQPEPEIPGDTLILLIAAAGLVLIILFGVIWQFRKAQR